MKSDFECRVRKELTCLAGAFPLSKLTRNVDAQSVGLARVAA